MKANILVMGISGCGKSTVAAAIGRALQCPTIEGDDHHLPASQDKMKRDIPLTDEDRMPWLDALGRLLADAEDSVVVSCSALKHVYRERLRSAAPALRIVYVHIDIDEAKRRVAARASHFFPASLVDNQFATLESPEGEQDVMRVEATQPVAAQCDAMLRWFGEPLTASTASTAFSSHS